MYLRVSTDEQAKEGYGLIYQNDKLRAFVQSQDYVLNEQNIYRDEGYSGSLPIVERPELQRLFQDAENKAFDVVLVYRLDRFFRKTRLILEAIERLNGCGVGFRSITESFDTTNITGRFMTTLLAAVAEMERDTIRERTTNGRIASAKDGRWVMGAPPYGYKLNKQTKKLEIEPEEAEHVKKFFHWIAYEKLSLRDIQRRTNKMGFRTPQHGKTRRVTLDYWHKRSIGRILTNETYTGIAYYRKYKRPFNNLTSLIDENLQRNKDEWIPMSVPPIVSREEFEAAKDQLVKNRVFAQRNLKHSYLFPKLVYCGECGFKMFGGFQPPRASHHAGTKYYHGTYRTPNEKGETKRCKTCPQIAETRLRPIWERLRELLERPETALERLSKERDRMEGQQDTDKRISSIGKQLSGLETKRRRLAQIYSEDETMDLKTYKKELEEIRGKDIALREERARLLPTILNKDDLQERAAMIRKLYEKLKIKLEGATEAQIQQIARLFIDKIIVYPKSSQAELVLNLLPIDKPTSMSMMPNNDKLRDIRARRVSRV